MFKVFNTQILNNKQRFTRALIFGIIATLISIVLYAFIVRFLRISSSLLFVAGGFFIGWVIGETGHGVQSKFSILAAVCTVCMILLGELFAWFGLSALNPSVFVSGLLFVIQQTLDVSIYNLMSLLFKVSAISISMQKARIL